MQSRLARGAAPVLIVSVLLLHACGSSDDPGTLTFDVNQDVSEQTISGDPGLAGQPLSTSVTVQMPDVTQEPEYQSEVFDFVEEVALTEVSLAIAPSSPQPDFSFIDSLSVWIGPVGGPHTEQIAFLDPGDPQLAPGSTTLQLQTTGVDLTTLIQMGVYEIRVDVEGTVVPDDVIFDGGVVIEVLVRLF
jgi:hypothetical protein